MLTLYHNDMSTCAQKVRFALAEKGLDWEGRHLDLRALDQQKPEYLELNPNAVVPTLVHDDLVVIESTVINEYVDDAFPGPALRPSSAAERARMRLWTKKLDEGLHAATGVISTAIAFRYQKLDKGEESIRLSLQNTPDPDKRLRNESTIFEGVKSRYFAGAVIGFDTLLAQFETTLARHPWLAGSDFSLADIAYAPYMTRLDHLQMGGMWSKRPRVADWYGRLAARQGYRQGLERWFNAKYLALMAEKGQEAWPTVEQVLDKRPRAQAAG